MSVVVMGLVWMVSAAAPDGSPARQLGVFAPEQPQSVDPEKVDVLRQSLVREVKASGLFLRVVDAPELAVSLNPQLQLDLALCVDPRCVTGVAGTYGTDLALVGITHVLLSTVLPGDNAIVWDARLIDLTTGETLSHENVVLTMVTDVVGLANNLMAPLRPVPVPQAAGSTPPTSEAAKRTGTSGFNPLAMASGGALAAGLGLTAGAVIGVAIATGWFALLSVREAVGLMVTPALERTPRYIALRVGPSLMMSVSVLAAVVGLIVLAVGGAGLGVGLAGG